MSNRNARTLLGIMLWIFIGSAFHGIVQAYKELPPGMRILFPDEYRAFVYLILPLTVILLNWPSLLRALNVLPFARFALEILIAVDWFYMALILPQVVRLQLGRDPNYGQVAADYTVGLSDVIVLLSFNALAVALIGIFASMSKTYKKEHEADEISST
jgi:hypothetical protein